MTPVGSREAPARRRTGLALGGALVAVLLALPACGSSADLEAEAAAALQDGVLRVTEAAAAGRYDDADAGIAELRDELESAVDAGQVSAPRYAVIDDALDRTADEVSAARAAAEQVAAEQAAAQQVAAEQVAAEQAAAEQAALDQAALDQAALEQEAADQARAGDDAAGSDGAEAGGGPGANGRGNGPGKGPGNGAGPKGDD